MRGVASLMVAYFHLARGNRDFLSHENFFYQLGRYGWAGVEIFFVISGFILIYAMHRGGYTIGRIHKFMAKRLIRLEPPYIISIVMVLILMYVSTLSPYYRGEPLNIDWRNVLYHLGYINAFTGDKWLQDVYWTLAIEFEFYIGISLLYPLLTHKKKIYTWAALLFLAGLSFLPANTNHVFYYLPLFLVGIILSLKWLNILNKTEYLIALIVALCLCYKIITFLTILIVITVLVIEFVTYAPKVLLWLGDISYSLYLIHIPIGGRIINISEVLISSDNIRTVMVFVALGACLGLAHLFYIIVEKPFIRLSKKVHY